MKITKVETIVLRLPKVEDTIDGTQDDAIIRLETDEGLIGIGEVDAPPTVVRAMVEAPLSHSWAKGLEQLLIGENPLNIGYLWQKLYQGSVLYGRRGFTLNTMSGIDIALWDLAGKYYGAPVCQLLGGTPKRKVVPYSSIYPFGETEDEVVEKCEKMVKKLGFRAVKFQCDPIGLDDRKALKLTRVARDALGGNIDLMLDACMRFDTKSAIRFAKSVEPYDVYFLEAALDPDNLEGYSRLSSATSIKIAAGEEQTSRFMFIDLMDKGKIDVVQPDVTRAGGLTESKRVGELAQDRGVLFIPHAYKTGIGIAASLHLSAALPNSPYAEFPKTGSVLRQRVTNEEFEVRGDGTIELPDKHGLGITLDEDILAEYRYR